MVRDINTHIDVIKKIITFCDDFGLTFIGIDYSPIKGPAGNIEYLLYEKYLKGNETIDNLNDSIDKIINNIVSLSHKELNQ